MRSPGVEVLGDCRVERCEPKGPARAHRRGASHSLHAHLGGWPLPTVGGRRCIAHRPNQGIFCSRSQKTLTRSALCAPLVGALWERKAGGATSLVNRMPAAASDARFAGEAQPYRRTASIAAQRSRGAVGWGQENRITVTDCG